MHVRIVVVLLLALVFAVFVGVNWSVFVAPTTLSVLVTTVQAPLGLVLLGLLGLVVLLFAIYMAWWQGRILLDARRHTKELQSQRELADKAEASRFTELRMQLDAKLTELSGRIDERTQELRTEVQHSANGLAAMVGELDHRIEGRRATWEPTRPA